MLARQAARIVQLEEENQRLSNLAIRGTSSLPSAREPSRELLRLRGEVGVLQQQTNELGETRKENIRLAHAVAESETNQLPVEDQVIMRQTHAVDAMTTLLQAIKSYATKHNGQFPVKLDELISTGDLGATNLAGNLGLKDSQFGQRADVDPHGNQVILRLQVPIAKPGGGGIIVVGTISRSDVPYTSVWNISP